MQRDYHGHSSNEFRYKAELEQILREYVLQYGTYVLLHLALHVRTESHYALAGAFGYDILNACKRAAADEEYVCGVYLYKLLMGVLAAALRWNARYRSFQYLKQRLLHALAGNVAGYGGILALTGDLVDFVDVYYALFRTLNVVIRRLNELEQYVFYVLAYVASLRERCSVSNGKWNVEYLRKGLGQHGLTAAGRPQHDYVALLQLHVVLLLAGIYALIVVVHGDGQRTLGGCLTYHILIESIGNLLGFRYVLEVCLHRGEVLVYYFLAKLYALIADVHAGARDYAIHLVLWLSAE